MSRVPDSENVIPPRPDPHDSVLQTKTGPVANQERVVSIEGRQVIAGRYAILGALGRGGMGEVWHAFDLKLRVDVALKSLRTDRAQHDVELLRREVRTAREVISPNVCRIFDLVVEEGQELVSMEYIDGITLAELLQRGPLEPQQAAEIASQFLAATIHTLPYKELLTRLYTFTNLRVIADNKADTGYKLDVGPFPGWEKTPEW
jgi:hypothetical protein